MIVCGDAWGAWVYWVEGDKGTCKLKHRGESAIDIVTIDTIDPIHLTDEVGTT